MDKRHLRTNNYNLVADIEGEWSGYYQIPQIQPVYVEKIPEMVSFYDYKPEKNGSGKGVHFCTYDYVFERVWTNPQRYAEALKKYELAVAPDFSTYIDYPRALQIYNHWRKHVIAAYWQRCGITVVPMVRWGNPTSFEWCFEGEPVGGTIMIGNQTTNYNAHVREIFRVGYEEMMQRLKPKNIIFIGKVPNWCWGEITEVIPDVAKIDEKMRKLKGKKQDGEQSDRIL